MNGAGDRDRDHRPRHLRRPAHRRRRASVATSVTVTADTILINTGSEPIIPDIPGLRESRARRDQHRADRDARVLPERLVIVGGGYIGIEFAAIYRHFGSAGHRCSRPRRGSSAARTTTSRRPRRGILTGDGIEIDRPARTSRRCATASGGAIVVYEQDGRAAHPRGRRDPGRRRSRAGDPRPRAGGRRRPHHRRGRGRGRRAPAHQPAAHLRARRRQRRPAAHLHLARRQPHRPRPAHRRRAGARVADRVAIPHTLFMTPPLATVGLTETRGARRPATGSRSPASPSPRSSRCRAPTSSRRPAG